jgi:hypothetical protein
VDISHGLEIHLIRTVKEGKRRKGEEERKRDLNKLETVMGTKQM